MCRLLIRFLAVLFLIQHCPSLVHLSKSNIKYKVRKGVEIDETTSQLFLIDSFKFSSEMKCISKCSENANCVCCIYKESELVNSNCFLYDSYLYPPVDGDTNIVTVNIHNKICKSLFNIINRKHLLSNYL